MDSTFVLCPNIIGILGLVLLLVFTQFNFYLDKTKLRLFAAAVICNLIIICMETTDFMLAQTPFDLAFMYRRITSALGFVLTPVIPMLIAYIAKKNKLPAWIPVPAAVNCIISITSIFTGHLFYIDEFNSYCRGPLFALMIAISAFYLLLLVYISFKNIKSARLSETIFLFGIFFVIIIANVLEIVFSFHFVIWNCCAVLLISYYLFLHIQYFKFDPLTNIFNRNMFNYDVDNMDSAANVGIISFDLNGLKEINDTHGHEQGDLYIIRCARIIDECFSDCGHVYRIGGDEFVAMMKNTSYEEICERIKNMTKESEKANISIACGFSYCETITDISQMLRDADNAMYENKRDRILNR